MNAGVARSGPNHGSKGTWPTYVVRCPQRTGMFACPLLKNLALVGTCYVHNLDVLSASGLLYCSKTDRYCYSFKSGLVWLKCNQ